MRSRARRLAIAVCGVITVTLMVLLGGALVNVHQLYGRQHALLVSQQAEVRMVTGDLKACTSDLKETNEKTAMTKEWLAVTSPDAALQDDKRSCKHKLKSVTAKIQEKEADLRSRKVSRDSKNEMTLLMSKILARLTGQEPSETAKLSREDCRNAMIVEVHKQGDANLEYLQALSNAALLEKARSVAQKSLAARLDKGLRH